MANATTQQGPFVPEESGGYWVLVDSRTGGAVSYPTTKRNCSAEAATMNRAYAEAIAEQVQA
jgi:hypothetical protein